MMLSAQEIEDITNDIRRHAEKNCAALEKIIKETNKQINERREQSGYRSQKKKKKDA